MNAEINEEYLLSQSPQEWKWLLKEEGIIQNEDNNGWRDESFDMAVMPFMDLYDESKHFPLEYSLDWLVHLSQNIAKMEKEVKHLKGKIKSDENRSRFLQRQLDTCQNEWRKNVPEALLKVALDDDFQSVHGTLETCMNKQVIPDCLRCVQQAWSKHASFLLSFLEYHEQIRSLIGEQVSNTVQYPTLKRLLSINNTHDNVHVVISSWEIYSLVMLELQYLERFQKTWEQQQNGKVSLTRLESKASVVTNHSFKQSPSLILKKVLQDLRPLPKFFSFWASWHTERNAWITRLKLIHQRRSRLAKSLKKFDERTNNSSIEELQSNIDTSRNRLQKAKERLEVEITNRFDFEDCIEIIL